MVLEEWETDVRHRCRMGLLGIRIPAAWASAASIMGTSLVKAVPYFSGSVRHSLRFTSYARCLRLFSASHSGVREEQFAGDSFPMADNLDTKMMSIELTCRRRGRKMTSDFAMANCLRHRRLLTRNQVFRTIGFCESKNPATARCEAP